MRERKGEGGGRSERELMGGMEQNEGEKDYNLSPVIEVFFSPV